MTPNPYQQYQTTQVQTASTGDLIVLLYDGAVRFLSRARLALQEGRRDAAHEDLVRSQEIVLELLAGLDYERGGDLAVNLARLYDFMYHTLLEANLKRDGTKITTVIDLLDTIREAWRTVVRGAPSAGGTFARGGVLAA